MAAEFNSLCHQLRADLFKWLAFYVGLDLELTSCT